MLELQSVKSKVTFFKRLATLSFHIFLVNVGMPYISAFGYAQILSL